MSLAPVVPEPDAPGALARNNPPPERIAVVVNGNATNVTAEVI